MAIVEDIEEEFLFEAFGAKLNVEDWVRVLMGETDLMQPPIEQLNILFDDDIKSNERAIFDFLNKFIESDMDFPVTELGRKLHREYGEFLDDRFEEIEIELDDVVITDALEKAKAIEKNNRKIHLREKIASEFLLVGYGLEMGLEEWAMAIVDQTPLIKSPVAFLRPYILGAKTTEMGLFNAVNYMLTTSRKYPVTVLGKRIFDEGMAKQNEGERIAIDVRENIRLENDQR